MTCVQVKKLPKNTFPAGHSADDFSCFPPIARRDGEFEGTMLADLGSFDQSGRDSNKYYNACVTQSKIDSSWYCYFEFGRTGSTSTFQMVPCDSKESAIETYIKQCESKNVKRGVWVDHPTLGKLLEPKPKKDLYLVRAQATRSVSLPDARRITETKTIVNSTVKLDSQTLSLLKDLNTGTLSYTKGLMVSGSIPTQEAIDEARVICDEATKVLNKLDPKEYDEDKDIIQYSNLLYRRIPKKKGKNDLWKLTPDLVNNWRQDLDAFEASLHSNTHESSNPLSELNLVKLKWIPKDEPQGAFMWDWWPKATRGKHSYLGKLKPINIWYVERVGDSKKLTNYQQSINVTNFKEKPLHQPNREDPIDKEAFKNSNTFFLFHGTKSFCVSGILRESLRLPKELSSSIITAAMFGGGVYWADDILKSVGYTSHQGSCWAGGKGGLSNRGAFMFIGDVCLGNMEVAKYCQTKLSKGYNSLFGKAGDSGVQNNEFVVFNTNCFRLRYLVEFK